MHARACGAQYERLPSHVADLQEETYLVTIPYRSVIEFKQIGREARCPPGCLIIERGDAPYRFSYSETNDLLVVKLPKTELADRLREPDRFCATMINLREGLGWLFRQTVENVARLGLVPEHVQQTLGVQLVELLALMLDGERPSGTASTVRAAHLNRAQNFIRANLKAPGLSPEKVAEACGISKRYLHKLFAEGDLSVAGFIRDQRLMACKALLQAPKNSTITEIAYVYGFSDQAQFSRLFSLRFGESPRSFRARHRLYPAPVERAAPAG